MATLFVCDPPPFPQNSAAKYGFYEFFAGSGMVRLGLGKDWKCLLANDFSRAKCRSYSENFGDNELVQGDVARLRADAIPLGGHLAWASFPCQDLSIAGNRSGLSGVRSGTFWPFVQHLRDLAQRGSRVPVIVLENVVGLLSSNGGEDFAELAVALADSYQIGAMVLDACHWLPQSRPRLFVVCVAKEIEIPGHLKSSVPILPWHTAAVQKGRFMLPEAVKQNWIWWTMPTPPARSVTLADIVEDSPMDVEWNTHEATQKLLKMMTPSNLQKVDEARASGKRQIGAIYKRTRVSPNGARVQRAEVRFDGLAGCLRTPGGGSSRQTILSVNGNEVQSRLLSAREAARLMGLPEGYRLPPNYNDAYHLTGDGVAVPVVSWLAEYLLAPLVESIAG